MLAEVKDPNAQKSERGIGFQRLHMTVFIMDGGVMDVSDLLAIDEN